MANVNWRTINIDALDPDSPANFDIASLAPAVTPVSTADVQSLATQIRQLLRGGDSEGALQGALENAPYGADDKGKVRLYMLLNTTLAIPHLSRPIGVVHYNRMSLRMRPFSGTLTTVGPDRSSQQPVLFSRTLTQAPKENTG
jgi:hypothetical protein